MLPSRISLAKRAPSLPSPSKAIADRLWAEAEAFFQLPVDRIKKDNALRRSKPKHGETSTQAEAEPPITYNGGKEYYAANNPHHCLVDHHLEVEVEAVHCLTCGHDHEYPSALVLVREPKPEYADVRSAFCEYDLRHHYGPAEVPQDSPLPLLKGTVRTRLIPLCHLCPKVQRPEEPANGR